MDGSTLEWSIELADDLVPGSAFRIRVRLTKVNAPDVEIGWEVAVEG